MIFTLNMWNSFLFTETQVYTIRLNMVLFKKNGLRGSCGQALCVCHSNILKAVDPSHLSPGVTEFRWRVCWELMPLSLLVCGISLKCDFFDTFSLFPSFFLLHFQLLFIRNRRETGKKGAEICNACPKPNSNQCDRRTLALK